MDPGHKEARRTLGELLLDAGDVDGAINHLKATLESDDLRNATEAKDSVLIGQRILRLGRKKDAADIFELVLKGMENWGLRSQCAFFEGLDLADLSEFEALTRALLELRNYCGPTEHWTKAVYSLREGDAKGAIEELKLQIHENPYYGQAYALLAKTYREQGRREEALKIAKDYFRFEKQVGEKCRVFYAFPFRRFEDLDEDFVKQAEESCERFGR